MNILIGLLGIAIFAAAIYGILKHQKSTPSNSGMSGGGVVIDHRPGDGVHDEFPSDGKNRPGVE